MDNCRFNHIYAIEAPVSNKAFTSASLVLFHSKDAKTNGNQPKGTANLVDICLQVGIKYFFHVSSNAAIGSTIWRIGYEKTEWKFNKKTSQYSVSNTLLKWKFGAVPRRTQNLHNKSFNNIGLAFGNVALVDCFTMCTKTFRFTQ